MKKLLIIIFCSSAFTLTACNEKPKEVTPQKTTADSIPNPIVPTVLTNLSHNNIADIRSDFQSVQRLMNNMATESSAIEKKFESAAATGNADAIAEVKTALADFTTRINQSLDDLPIQSNEVYIVRYKLKQLNKLHADLIIVEMEPTPDPTKLAELTAESEKQQQQIQEYMMQLQQLINAPQPQ